MVHFWIYLRYETDKHELVLGQILCLEASSASSSSPPVINKCHEMGGKNRFLLFISYRVELKLSFTKCTFYRFIQQVIKNGSTETR